MPTKILNARRLSREKMLPVCFMARSRAAGDDLSYRCRLVQASIGISPSNMDEQRFQAYTLRIVTERTLDVCDPCRSGDHLECATVEDRKCQGIVCEAQRIGDNVIGDQIPDRFKPRPWRPGGGS
jgi:hypothetical protein